MEDSEVVAAIAAGDPAGLAGAYDTYAAPLYGYCRWMLREPAFAADALLDTFVTAGARLGGLKDAGQLRAWLYAAARDECCRRLRTAGAAFDETADEAGQPAGAGERAEHAEVRKLIRATLAELEPAEHEVIELSIRHSLYEAELAAVLQVSWSRAHALTSRARDHLEKALGALLIARTGRQACPELGTVLADWDGRLTVETGKLTAQHIEQCERCAQRRHGTLRPEVLAGLLPLAALPDGLREPILQRVGISAARRTRRPHLGRAGSLGLSGLQRVGALLRWSRIRANPGAATAAAAVALWTAAALSATLITVTGMHAVRALAVQTHRGAAAASTPAAGSYVSASAGPRTSRSPEPTRQPTPAGVPPPVAPTVTPSPTKSAKPKPSHSATPSASASPSASSSPSASPSPTPTHSRTPSPTPTPTTTPSPFPR
jgi:RNA polymerase sigma factor (sigma-70 family)